MRLSEYYHYQYHKKVLSLIISGLLGIILVCIASLSSLWAETQVIRLTDNFCPDSYPQMCGDLLTWQAFIDQNSLDRLDGDWEIFYCRLSPRQTEYILESVKQVTDNLGDDIAPQTNGEYIAWQGEGENSSEIFLYDSNNKTINQITHDTKEDFLPQIWGDWIVWSSRPQKEGILQPGEIFLYQISAKEVTLLSESVDRGNILNDTSPRIGYVPENKSVNNDLPFGNLVLWSQSDGENSTFFLYNLDTRNTKSVPEGFVWPETRQRNEYFHVVSRSLRDMYGQDREIFVYKATSKQYQQITNNTYPDHYPCLQDRTIVWMGGEGESTEIFLAFYDPNASWDIPVDLNTLNADNILPVPVITPSIHSDSDFTPPNSSSSTGASAGQSLAPDTRCFIGSCRPEKK